ncbi:hypothetical protein FNV43_RR22501 [Rhamnella rubrinervis]|uniref:BZIP domain-containing protein n=1 Tax=Rhamnella rubrinervis TaxID=2594499 RepID=A0A8K0E242_9ROSA|nr:hypothetical protein FNV43_RR22501 [Rhamnella rubrinervis]
MGWDFLSLSPTTLSHYSQPKPKKITIQSHVGKHHSTAEIVPHISSSLVESHVRVSARQLLVHVGRSRWLLALCFEFFNNGNSEIQAPGTSLNGNSCGGGTRHLSPPPLLKSSGNAKLREKPDTPTSVETCRSFKGTTCILYMGSHMDFKNFGDAPPGDSNDGKQAGNFALARQPSIYSLTFDELQNTLGGLGKDFGSMNMDELLKNIGTAEETQIITATVGAGGVSNPGGNLQRQGSLTLPRTLSQKTVDEVWRDLLREGGGGNEGSGGGGTNLPRQQTLGEMTLEEFLVRAGVVREDAQQIARSSNGGFFSELYRPNGSALGYQQPPNNTNGSALGYQQPPNNTNGSALGYQQPPNNSNGSALGYQQPYRNNGFLDNQVTQKNNNSAPNQPPTLALNIGGVRSSQQHMQQPSTQQHPLLPKPATIAFASPKHLVSNSQLDSQGTRGVVGVAEPAMNTTLVQGGGLPAGGIGMAGLGAAVSPASHRSSDVIRKSNVDTSSLSPVPYVFSRGRKSGGALEKVVERRQRRMIKNRESAARSRARKQAYTLELEAEVAKLKEMNQELQRKQAECMEIQKNQILETMDQQWGNKRQCLRRTLTGPCPVIFRLQYTALRTLKVDADETRI